MSLNYDYSKSIGPTAGRLTTTLYSRNHPVFHFQEAAEILGDRNAASKALARLVKSGVVTRLKSRIFRLVPAELGFEREYLGNPYVIARELALNNSSSNKISYYLAYGSAFDLHQMTTQPQMVVYTNCPKMIHSRIILGTEFRFMRCKTKDLFGITDIWIDKTEKVCVSDLERTLLDGLKQPDYCSGFSEVAKGFSIKHSMIDPQKLIDYAMQLNVGAVTRRLGYLMELYQIGSRIHWEFLQTQITATYQLLDPSLPGEGRYVAKWRLRLNIPEEELQAIRKT